MALYSALKRRANSPSGKTSEPGFPTWSVRDGQLELEFRGPLDHERNVPAGRQMNRFETEILTSLKEPELLDGRAGEVD